MHRLIIIAVVSLGLFITAHGHSNVWNGMRPLHSTQLEVEKRWGSPVSKDHFPYFGDTAKYQIEGRLVTFEYSSQS